ncbi:MAG: hypothetical protein NTU45_06430 [Planctomycetota bacterium]|nr:hypothetical protein [Planctomycetota bacterium]
MRGSRAQSCCASGGGSDRFIAGDKRQVKLVRVDFRLGEIEKHPAADASVDAVISRCGDLAMS